MKPPLKFEKPPFHKRILFGAFAMFIICFSSVLLALPVLHIARELSTGNVPWPLVGFACLSVPFGALMIWIGARYRVWVLPYQFTVRFSEKVCGYFWRDSWVDKTDISGVVALVTAPAHSSRMWPWAIYARFVGERDRKVIFNSHAGYSSERTAFQHSFEICSRIADYLGVPVEFDEWSPEIIRQYKQGEQGIDTKA